MSKERLTIYFSFILIFFVVLTNTHQVWGHAFVIEQSPAPNSKLETPPEKITIAFNSEVEKDLAVINILNENEEIVVQNPVQISDNKQEISIELPILENGVYKVEYYVVSSNDGHPIQDSYLFTVENTTTSTQQPQEETRPEPPTSTNNPVNNDNPSINNNPIDNSNPSSNETLPTTNDSSIQTDTTVNENSLSEILYYVMRSIYYIGFILIIGWVFWWKQLQGYPATLKKKYLFWGTIIQMIHLVGLISMILVQLDIFANYGISLPTDFSLLSGFGFMWFGSLLMSLIGLFLLFRNKWFDYTWILFLIAAKSLEGHSVEFQPIIVSIVSNSIHLLAAAIWAAGLLFIITFWRKQRLYIQSFVPIFSKYAFHSIIILSITGFILSVIIYLNAGLVFNYWTLFLVLKLLAVLLVIITGYIIRKKIKESSQTDLGKWITFDFSIMIAIVILVSILTTLNPLG
ncbi:hypothetical protein D8M04_13145 [Oceanobacillus piezotolerans]|uniref:CopC domain-containing protein n=1 Tax=Oceanobacillus piezotolerans TaxID=2448030 RepID=A0A498DLJ2_9BACI|nr:copper resistance protein CopC [Oceanobacillus piezotolerans]RLL43849.1 hypothetical protein D8M04_13145 [Oceanobacillus piezotolerans]